MTTLDTSHQIDVAVGIEMSISDLRFVLADLHYLIQRVEAQGNLANLMALETQRDTYRAELWGRLS